MIEATTAELLGYFADVIERAERFGATVLPPNDRDEVAWERDGDHLVMNIGIRPAIGRRSRLVEIVLQEQWRALGGDRWRYVEYNYELRNHELDYRRALHCHAVEYFVRTHGVATHEHCEAFMGQELCSHYAGVPVEGALDGFSRLYDVWLTGSKPDCSALRCLD